LDITDFNAFRLAFNKPLLYSRRYGKSSQIEADFRKLILIEATGQKKLWLEKVLENIIILSCRSFTKGFAPEMVLEAVRQSYLKVTVLLLKKFNLDPNPALFEAKSDDLVRVLVNHGADIHTVDQNQNTLLHRTNSISVAKYLLKEGCDLNARNFPFRSTCLHYASTIDLASLYLNNGASVTVTNDRGYTPLHLLQTIDTASLLIQRGANVNAQSLNGETPLHNSLNHHFTKLLLDNGAVVDMRNERGQTPLHLCYKLEVAIELVKFGANVNAVDQDGNVPLHFCKSVEMAKFMVERGAKLLAINYAGYSTLDYCPAAVAFYLFERIVESGLVGQDEIERIANASLHNFDFVC
jgi:ankyrin repeat protein